MVKVRAYNFKRVAKETGFDRKTVHKVSQGGQVSRAQSQQKSKLVPYKRSNGTL
ncbi:hypothetical protein BSM4216_0869 [Bacillus smithii]|nr:hypothetical protein BSM4216_0869 [Bacillus smithii]